MEFCQRSYYTLENQKQKSYEYDLHMPYNFTHMCAHTRYDFPEVVMVVMNVQKLERF